VEKSSYAQDKGNIVYGEHKKEKYGDLGERGEASFLGPGLLRPYHGDFDANLKKDRKNLVTRKDLGGSLSRENGF